MISDSINTASLCINHSLLRQMAAQKQEKNRAVKMKNTHNYRRKIRRRRKKATLCQPMSGITISCKQMAEATFQVHQKFTI